jgi:TolB-like protein/class 3 adenylate cyclase
MAREQRRLAAIVAADVVGYSRLMGRDESGTLTRLREHRKQRFEPVLARYGGRLVKLTGDGALVEFASAVDALGAAIEFQQAMAEANQDQPEDAHIVFRIGLHVGDLIVEGDDLYGDGVNVAARLEAEAPAGGIVTSRAVHEAVVDRLKARFDDLGSLALKNIERPVQAFRVRWDPADWKVSAPVAAAPMIVAASHPAAVPLTLPDKPSIAVLPFQNMSGDPEQEYFTDGMVEEIITALSRFKSLFVIARNSSFIYKGKVVDIKQVGRELGVRYVLEGSVRKAANKVRITGQLIDGESGTHLWADCFDGSLEDVFDLQHKVAISVAGVIEPALQAAEIRRSAARPTNDLTAYDLYLRAIQYARSWDRDGSTRALELCSQAFMRDPRYGAALALCAHCYVMLYVNGWNDDPAACRREGVDLARRVLRVGGDDPCTLARAAYVLGNLGEDIDSAIALIDRSLEMNPSFAHGWFFSGWLRLWAGQSDLAIDSFATAMRLSPYEMPARSLLGTGIGHFFARRFDEARATFLRSLQEFPGWAPNYRFLAACCAQMGRIDEAREIVQRLRLITPVLVPDASHWRNAEQRELYLSGLRLAVGESA